MIKRLPGRNSRSKGVKLKHVLQICVLLAVCFWLIYQVKHSHDKKKEFDEKDAKVTVETQTGNGVLKLGRKDPRSQIQDVINNDKHEEDEEEDTGLEELLKEEKEQEERTKQKEDQQEERIEEKEREEESKNKEEEELEEEEEEEIKNQDTEDEGRRGGEDELDEHVQEKIAETNNEEDSIDEEKEREEEVEETEIESNVDEEKGAEIDQETSTEDLDHDETGENSHEAREEHYKADDASSAVTHDPQIIGRELENETVDNSNENSARNDLEVDDTNDNNSDEYNGDKSKMTLEVGQDQIPAGSNSLNVTTNNEKNDVVTHTNVEDQSAENATSTSLANNQSVLSIKPTETNTEASNGNNSTWRSVEMSDSLQNREKVAGNDSPAENITVSDKAAGEMTNSQTTESEQVDKSNSDVSDSTNKTQGTDETDINSGTAEKFGTADAHNDTNDIATLPVVENDSGEDNETTKTDLKNESGETDEKPDASSGNREEAALTNDLIDSSDLQLAKEARIDLGTLPDTTTTGVNSRDSAAE